MKASRFSREIGLASLACALPPGVCACVSCDTATGEAVRAGIFGAGFLPTLLAIIAPFPVLLGAIALIHRALSQPNRGALSPSITSHP